jgi:hypothetical protein
MKKEIDRHFTHFVEIMFPNKKKKNVRGGGVMTILQAPVANTLQVNFLVYI